MSAPEPIASPQGRWRSLGAGAGALIGGRLVSAACGLAQVPIALAYLRPEGFGVWMALMGLLWSLGILDCGLGFALQNRVAGLLASGKQAESAALARRAILILVTAGGALMLIGAPVVIWGRWADWLGVTDTLLRGQIRAAVAVVLVATAAGLPLSLAPRLAAAVQQTWITGLWTAASSVTGLGAVMLAAHLGAPLAGFMIAGCVLPLGPHVLTWLQLHLRLAWLKRHREIRPDVRGLWQESGLFLMPQLGAAFIGTFVPTLIAFFAGAAAVAPYSVLQRLFGLALQIHSLLLLPVWPAYTEAFARHDMPFVRQAFRLSCWATLFCFALPAIVLVPLARPILHLWLGTNAPAVGTALLWSIAGWHVLQFGGQVIAVLLNATGRLHVLAYTNWAGIAVALALGAVWAPRFGAAGVVAGLAVPYLLLNLPVTAWQAWRILRGRSGAEPAPAFSQS